MPDVKQMPEDLRDELEHRLAEDPELKQMLERVERGELSFSEAYRYARRTSDVCTDILSEQLTSELLPDGLTEELAQETIAPTLREGHRHVNALCEQVQQSRYTRAGQQLKPQSVSLDEERLQGIVTEALKKETPEEAVAKTAELSESFLQHTVDESVRKNADFMYKAGKEPQVVRKAHAGCCPWCSALAGTYPYGDVKQTGNDVWRRHRYCRCTIDYIDGHGRVDRIDNIRRDERQYRSQRIRRIEGLLTDERDQDKIETRKEKSLLPKTLIISDKQFGKKVGKHAKDYGLKPQNKEDRERVLTIIHEVFYSYDEIRIGRWKGQTGDILFYIKNDDVVLSKLNGDFISIWKDGVNNAWVKEARKLKV